VSAPSNISTFDQAWAIVWAKLRIGRHQVASVRSESKLKVSVISVSALLLWIGAFAAFYYGFRMLMLIGGRGDEFSFGDILMSRMLSIFGLSVFFLLIFSNVLVAFATLYRSKEVIYLLQAPISYENFFYARFFECVSFSSWSLAYLGSPLILAYGLHTNASWLFYVAAPAFYIPYIVIPACLGCLLLMLLVRVFPLLNTTIMIILGTIAVGGLGAYITNIIRSTRVDPDTILPVFLNASQRINSPFLPSTWASDGILAMAQRDFGASLYYFALLMSTALFALWLSGRVAAVLFYPGWTYLMGQDRQRIKLPGRGLLGKLEKVFALVREPHRSLLVKDIKLFWRDPTQWSQFVIFFGIMAIYIANLRNTSRYYEEEKWRIWISCLNVGAISLILATLTSRFVYPLVSLEGRRFWILGLAPLTYRQLVWQKFWLSVLSTSGFTVGLALLSGTMLRLEPVYFFLTVYSVVAINFGLAGLAVGLGTLYPTFTEDNPARIVSGMGGTLNLLVSVAYIALIVATLVVVLQWRLFDFFGLATQFPLVFACALTFITGLTLACVAGPMRAGLKNLNDTEF